MTNDLIEVVFWSVIIFLVFKYLWYKESFENSISFNGLKQTENINNIVNHVTNKIDNDDLFYNDNKLSNFTNNFGSQINAVKDRIKRCTKTQDGPCVETRCGQWSRVPYSCNCGWKGSGKDRRWKCDTCHKDGHPCQRLDCTKRYPKKVPYWDC